MRTPIMERVDLIAISNQNNFFATQCDRKRPFTKPFRFENGVPVVAKSQIGGIVSGPTPGGALA